MVPAVDGSASVAAFDPARAPLVGRRRELAELEGALDAAVAGTGHAVLLGGEPGVGKTRLAAETAAMAGARGVPVAWGRGWEDGTAPPFWPWNAAVREVLRAGDRDAILHAAGADVAQVLPALREHLPELPAPRATESAHARFQSFDAVSRFLATLAAPAGLVVVLDDVHWADAASLKLLEYVAADLRHARLLLIATFRDTEVRAGHPFAGTLAGLAREPLTRRLTVGGFSPADCAEYVTVAGADGATIGATLHRETNGNPFFLGEIVRLLGTDGPWDVRRLPPGVREVVARRLERLGDDCRRALAVGALLGDGFTAERLAAVVAAGDAPAMMDLLRPAVRERILAEHADEPGRYAFAHALIRRVLIDDFEPSARAGWHARIAVELEAADATAGELVHHFAAAGTPAAIRRAFDHACRGAAQAARGLGWEEAARLYDVALDLGARCDAPDDALALRLERARALRRSGDVEGARACCREVVAAARETGRCDVLARAALIHAGPVPHFYRIEPEVRALLEEACRAADAVDDAVRSRLLARLAADIIAANDVEQMGRAFGLGEQAADAAQRAGDAGALAQALMVGFFLSALGAEPPPDAPAAAPTSLQDVLDAAEAADDLEFAAEVRQTRAAAMLAIGEPEGFWAEHDALATVAAATRVPEAVWLADATAALRATIEGRFDEGRRLADQALAVGVRMQLPNAAGVHVGQQVMWHALQGRLGALLPMLAERVRDHPTVAVWRAFHALAQLATGDAAAAGAAFRRLMAEGLEPARRGVNLRSYLAALSALCVGLRDEAQAPVLYDLVAGRAETWIVDGCATFGPWALALGALAHVAGRHDAAEAHLEEAIRCGQRLHAAPVVAHAQSLLAAVLLDGTPSRAAHARAALLLVDADQTARELNLVDVLARVGRLSDAAAPPPAANNALRREGDVWLVSFGGTSLRLKHGKGLSYLATLLGAPGREFHVLQLARAGAGEAAGPVDTAVGLTIGTGGAALDDSPDTRARQEYRARLADLDADVEEAEMRNDIGRAERLRDEREQLVTELAASFGSGRVRSPSETTRKAVTKALRTQIGKLLAEHPRLGRHLSDTVRMGTVCVYAPVERIEWDTRP